ncbi:MAG: substrate-binding domain-containing protein [Actinomycetota bacterium]|nr:substrate-binding domain-containing protein [Actinomycetota bacterium]
MNHRQTAKHPDRLRRRLTSRLVLALAIATGATAAVGAGASASHRPHASTKVVTATMAYEIAHAGQLKTNAFCGTKPITLGILDGLGVNAWSQYSMAAVRSEAAKCKNVKQVVEIADGNLQTAISQINSMVSQGVNAMTVIPDFGAAELPAIEAATRAGVKVVPWAANPGGKPGVDYVSYVDWVPAYSGRLFAHWMVNALHGKGNVIVLGGPAGNPVSASMLAGVVDVLKSHPGIRILTGTKNWAVTNWDPATAQQVTASLLAKYPTINGIFSDYGTDGLSALHAFQAANRKLPDLAVADANGLGCLWKQNKNTKNAFALATVSTRNWLGRVAARKAIAAAEGIKDTEPSLYDLTFYENSLAGMTPHCAPKQPAAAYLSDSIAPSVLAKWGKP